MRKYIGLLSARAQGLSERLEEYSSSKMQQCSDCSELHRRADIQLSYTHYSSIVEGSMQ